MALFAEDIDLLPAGLMTRLIADCMEAKGSTYDVLGGLFKQMNSVVPAPAGVYKGVRYFNGGLYGTVDPCELNAYQMYRLSEAAKEDWSKVNPAIFGSLFQSSMDDEERHKKGAHFTSEADIMRGLSPLSHAHSWTGLSGPTHLKN